MIEIGLYVLIVLILLHMISFNVKNVRDIIRKNNLYLDEIQGRVLNTSDNDELDNALKELYDLDARCNNNGVIERIMEVREMVNNRRHEIRELNNGR